MVGLRRECQGYVTKLCNHIVAAAQANADSMSNTESAGVDHRAIHAAVHDAKRIARTYDWDCMPGRWLTYCLLMALPYAERVVVQPQDSASPVLPDAQYSLPRAMGRVFDATVLSNDALRPLADDWCRHTVVALRIAGGVVCPLRTAAEERRESAKAAAAAVRERLTHAAPNP
jgi:hypothetical protein